MKQRRKDRRRFPRTNDNERRFKLKAPEFGFKFDTITAILVTPPIALIAWGLYIVAKY